MKFVRVCTKCGSTDTSYDLGLHAVALKFTTNNFKCNTCGFSGQVFPELNEVELKKFRKQLKN